MNKRQRKKKRDRILDLNGMICAADYDVAQRQRQLNYSLYDDNGNFKADEKMRLLNKRTETLKYERIRIKSKRKYKLYMKACRIADDIINKINSLYNLNFSRYDDEFFFTKIDGKCGIFILCNCSDDNDGILIMDTSISLIKTPEYTSLPMCLAPVVLYTLLNDEDDHYWVEY